MSDYLIMLIAVVTLSLQFVCTKMYQMKNGESLRSGVIFNIFTGFFTAVIFFAAAGGKICFTMYSCILAAFMTLFSGLYTAVGFKIMSMGSMAIYTLFLMLGGMLLPFAFGIVYLGEKLTVMQIIGIVLMILSMGIASDRSRKKGSILFFILCVCVFILNGAVSIVSKLHQIETVHKTVDANTFVMLTGLFRAILFALLLPFCKKDVRQKRHRAGSTIVLLFAGALLGGISFFLQLISAAKLPASMLYPIITGGLIVLNAVFGRVIYQEKLSNPQKVGIAMTFAATLCFV